MGTRPPTYVLLKHPFVKTEICRIFAPVAKVIMAISVANSVETSRTHSYKHKMLSTKLWRPKALKIDWVDFKQVVPNGIPAVLLHVIDRLEPQDHLQEYFKEYYPMHFDSSLEPYIQYLVGKDIMIQGADERTYELAAQYHEGEYYTLPLTTQLSKAIAAMLEVAEVSTGKVVIGKIASDYVHCLW